jgi:hypothetical protein
MLANKTQGFTSADLEFFSQDVRNANLENYTQSKILDIVAIGFALTNKMLT